MLPVKQFTAFVEQNHLFEADSRVLAAVSGGIDSVMMVNLLQSAGFTFGIAHCNFQLRGDESLRDQEFCHNLALQLRVPFHATRFDTAAYAGEQKISTQMAARDLRYKWFEQVRQQSEYDVIALAHHQNDAIETILLNLTRGTGIAGVHGILPKNGNLVRPLMFLNREEIQQLTAENKLAYVEDSSNASAKYARNKLRLEVIPQLKELNPALEQTFQRNLGHFRDLEELLELTVAEIKKKIFNFDDDEIKIPIEDLKKLQPKRLLVYQLLQEFGINETITDDLIASLYKHSGRVFETTGYRLVLDREVLIISRKKHGPVGERLLSENETEAGYLGYRVVILHDDSPLIVKDNPMAVSIDRDLLIYPLRLRTWQEGDRFKPLGMKTSKKLSDFFIAEKVPVHKKQEVPLLVNGNGDIIWIAGYRPDERYKVSGKTKKVTIFELFKR